MIKIYVLFIQDDSDHGEKIYAPDKQFSDFISENKCQIYFFYIFKKYMCYQNTMKKETLSKVEFLEHILRIFFGREINNYSSIKA